MKVSIIVPIYNSEKYLKRCLESIINQTLKDIQIILINDGSTDNSINICREYEKVDKRIILLDKNNEGVSIARNKGIEIATGEYLYFIDSDDYIELNTMEDMYNIAKESNADIILFNYYWGNDNLSITNLPKNRLLEGDELRQILSKSNTNYILPFSVRNIFKNNIIQKNIRFKKNLKYGEDSLYNLESYINAKSMYCSNKAFYHYMPNDDSVMSAKNKKSDMLLYLSNLYDEKLKLYEKYELDDFKEDLYNYTIQHTLIILIDNTLKNKNFRYFIEELEHIRNCTMILESFNNYSIDINDMKIDKRKKKILICMKDNKFIQIKLVNDVYVVFFKIRDMLWKIMQVFINKKDKIY